MNYTKQERNYYNIHRDNACEKLNITVNQYNWFRRFGDRLHKILENDCNGVYTEEESQTLMNVADGEIGNYIRANKLNLYSFFQTDPRGATIYLDTKPIERNRYTDTFCIY